MSEEKTIDVETVDSLKPVEPCQGETSPMPDQRDSGRKNSGRGPAPTPRRIRAGELLLTGQATSTGEALVKAGFSRATAHNPRQNDLSPERLLRDAAAVIPESDHLGSLRPLATRRLRRILEDENEVGSVVSATAIAVHRVSAELNEDGTGALTAADLYAARRYRRVYGRRALRAGVHLVARLGSVNAALQAVEAFEQAERIRFPKLAAIETSRPAWSPGGQRS